MYLAHFPHTITYHSEPILTKLERPDYSTTGVCLWNFCERFAGTRTQCLSWWLFLLFWPQISSPIVVYQPLVITVPGRHKSKSQEKYFCQEIIWFPPKSIKSVGISPKTGVCPQPTAGISRPFCQTQEPLRKEAWDKENVINIFLHGMKISSNIMKRKYHQYLSQWHATARGGFYAK